MWDSHAASDLPAYARAGDGFLGQGRLVRPIFLCFFFRSEFQFSLSFETRRNRKLISDLLRVNCVICRAAPKLKDAVLSESEYRAMYMQVRHHSPVALSVSPLLSGRITLGMMVVVVLLFFLFVDGEADAQDVSSGQVGPC